MQTLAVVIIKSSGVRWFEIRAAFENRVVHARLVHVGLAVQPIHVWHPLALWVVSHYHLVDPGMKVRICEGMLAAILHG